MFKRRRTPFSSMTRHPFSDFPPKTGSQDPRHTVRDGLNFGSRANGLRGGQTALGVDQVGREDSVDKGRFSETSLA
jgi:hypothetical protein